MPGGKAFLLFFPLLEGRPSSLVAGTVSKYGSYILLVVCRTQEVFVAYLLAKVIGHSLSQHLLANVFCDHARHDGGIVVDDRTVET